MWNPIALTGRIFYNMGFFARTLKGVGYFIRHSQASFKILVMQILFTFVHALGITTLLALAIGAAVNVIGAPMLAMISQQQLLYSILIMIIVRELGPLLMALSLSRVLRRQSPRKSPEW